MRFNILCVKKKYKIRVGSEFDMGKLYIKKMFSLLTKHWKYIVVIVGITFVISCIYNLGFKKLPEPGYTAEGSIDFSGVVFYGETQPSVNLDGIQERQLFYSLLDEFGVKKEDIDVKFEMPSQQKVEITAKYKDQEKLESLINKFFEMEESSINNKFVLAEPKKIASDLGQDAKKDIADPSGNISLIKVQALQKRLNDDLSACKQNILTLKNNIQSNEYDIVSSQSLLQKIKSRLGTLKGENILFGERKAFNLELSIESYIFKRDYLNASLKKNEGDIVTINKDIDNCSRLYNSIILNSSIKKDRVNVVKDLTVESRARGIAISTLLGFILICFFVLIKEIYLGENSLDNTQQ